jgi:hypothetical protein
MTQTGWLEQPQEWRAIPEDDRPRKRFAESPLKDRLNGIVKAGAAGRPFLVRHVPASERRRLARSASDYRRRYGKAGFTFTVRPVPNEDQVGVWVVWTPPHTVSDGGTPAPGFQGGPQAG